MGDRYFVDVECPNCRHKERDVYYAPTCGFTSWTCPKCSLPVDLEKLTGISYEDASNLDEIKEAIKNG